MVLLAACGMVFTGAAAANAQPVPADQAARAVSTVMDYRRSFMADPLPFEACAVRRALGGSEDFASNLSAQVRGLLDDAASPCPRPYSSGRSAVYVDSVRVADPGVRVYLTVLRGELIHREIHTLDPRSTAAYMGVREVRLWGNSQFYPARPLRNPNESGR
jgi:hypothetical protein